MYLKRVWDLVCVAYFYDHVDADDLLVSDVRNVEGTEDDEEVFWIFATRIRR